MNRKLLTHCLPNKIAEKSHTYVTAHCKREIKGLSTSAARVIACRTLLRLTADPQAFAAEALAEEIGRMNPTELDARLAANIAYLTLRNAYLLDYQYRPLLRQAPSRLSHETRTLLRMAACQKLLLARLPDHAIANETVELSRRVLRLPQRESAFINAIVRRIVQLPELRLPGPHDPDYLKIRYSMPEWLIDLFRQKFGDEHLEPLLAALNVEPEITLRCNRLISTMDDLSGALSDLGAVTSPGVLSPDALRVEGIPLRTLIASGPFARGTCYLQDEGSQVIGWLCEPRAGDHILDLCAAPGGKTTHLAEIAKGKALITATDISPRRIELLRENLKRLGTPGIEIKPSEEIAEDTTTLYDRVLVDAPCSGLGTLRRNPEIRYRCTPAELARLGDQQLELLRSAALKVKPGGLLIYSTCTITDEENRQVVERFRADHPGFEVYRSRGLPVAIESLRMSDGAYRTWPDHASVDGFEVVVLRRTS